MRVRHGSFRENIRSLLRFCFVIPALVALGCASSPNLLYYGAPEYVDRDGVRRVAGVAEFPVVVTAMNHQKKIEIVWTWRGAFLGEWYWWRWETIPFATARQATFTLHVPGMKGGTLCTSKPIPNTGQVRSTFECEFDVAKYFGQPLVGLLDYCFNDIKEPEGDGKMKKNSSEPCAEDSPEAVARTYYLIEEPVPVDPPK